MAPKVGTANLFEGVKAKSGGLIGVKHNCRLTFQVEEKALEKKDKATGAVIQRWNTNCVVAITIAVLDPGVDPEYANTVQYLTVGRVPLWRTQQLGETPETNQVKFPGGFGPSPDGEQYSTAGPFVRIEDEDGIYENAEWMLFVRELMNIASSQGQLDALKNALTTQGVYGINSIEVFLDEMAKPKGKKATKTAAEAAAAGKEADKERTVIVPTRVNKWPWAAASAQPIAAAPAVVAPGPVAAPAIAPAPVAVAAVATPQVVAPAVVPQVVNAAAPVNVAPAAAQPSAAVDYDALAIEWIRRIGAASPNNTIPSQQDLVNRTFAETGKAGAIEPAARTQVMTRINNPAWIQSAAAAGHFLVDPSGAIMVVG